MPSWRIDWPRMLQAIEAASPRDSPPSRAMLSATLLSTEVIEPADEKLVSLPNISRIICRCRALRDRSESPSTARHAPSTISSWERLVTHQAAAPPSTHLHPPPLIT